MAKKWYVVHTYSGHENRVKLSLQERIERGNMQHLFGEILIPSEKVRKKVAEQERVMSRKLFPGYILVEMDLNQESYNAVKETPKVTGFLGGLNPIPVSEKEVENVKVQTQNNPERIAINFDQGDSVRVKEGPFANFSGSIKEVRPEKRKVLVLVSIFGRATPVELDYEQVEKA